MNIKATKALNILALKPKIQKQKMPVRILYKFTKLFNSLEEETKFYNNRFQEIIEKYSEKDENNHPKITEDGNGIVIKEDKIEECSVELAELDNLEIEVIDTLFSIDELENLDFTYEEFNTLLPFIEE